MSADKELLIKVASKADTAGLEAAKEGLNEVAESTEKVAEKSEEAEGVASKLKEGFAKLQEEAGSLRGAHHIFEAISLSARGGQDAISGLSLGTRILSEAFEALLPGVGPIIVAFTTLGFLASDYLGKQEDKAEKAEGSADREKKALENLQTYYKDQVDSITAVINAMDDQQKKQAAIETDREAFEKLSDTAYTSQLAFEGQLNSALTKRAESQLELNRTEALKNATTDAQRQDIQNRYDVDKANLEGQDSTATLKNQLAQQKAAQEQAEKRADELQDQITEKEEQLAEFQRQRNEAINDAKEKGFSPKVNEKGELDYSADISAQDQKLGTAESERAEALKKLQELKANDANNALNPLYNKSVNDSEIRAQQNTYDQAEREAREEREKQDALARANAYFNKDKRGAYDDQANSEIDKLRRDQIQQQQAALESSRKQQLTGLQLDDEAAKIKAQQNDLAAKEFEQQKKNVEEFAEQLQKEQPQQPGVKGAKPPKSLTDQLNEQLLQKSQAEQEAILKKFVEDHAKNATTPEAKNSLLTADAHYESQKRTQEGPVDPISNSLNPYSIQNQEEKKQREAQQKADEAEAQKQVDQAQDILNNDTNESNHAREKEMLELAVNRLKKIQSDSTEFSQAAEVFASAHLELVNAHNQLAGKVKSLADQVKTQGQQLKASKNYNSL